MKPLAAAVAVFALSACAGNPQRLPVALSICNAVAVSHGLALQATVENKSDRPISNLALDASFYRDFHYADYAATARLRQELDPGQSRTVTFDLESPAGHASGEAMRCTVTHIGYLDGTSDDLPISR